ncbi:hypothetical protein Kpol_478p14 [Vanderwaltozyma polyspora DSM 70294]|uniref:Pumilio homology domain family member 3 n=1 Tax=Vanderwaltozyma polyspora (strain ATCC 22028 / DSM 70294 / BCRC 21397 / CBS 2163 / NBRC 10782 / NRRL Y-8283 / UCD 57-17) TaxID=436907 RepID=A7TPN3_VANPO|nr:uncharacterized protein Kpol_478p14 [Vanderwaltozyma polyspora DSM 70294]EDO15778.1 hypothetical protein Kpol_478p14 [Vanderwaltozyma polyspora DSM 70294]
MSVTDPWAYSDFAPPSRGNSPILQNDNGVNNNKIDSELASIVSSLSALSNPGFGNTNNANNNNNNNNNNNSLGSSSHQIGSFRRSSVTTTTSGGSIANDDQNANPNMLDANDLSFLQKSLLNSANNRKSPMSVGTAPIMSGNNARMNILGHYSASINGPLLFSNSNNQQSAANEGFFEKFGKSLIEGTKELENSNLSASNSSTNIQDFANKNSMTLSVPTTTTAFRRASINSSVTDVTANTCSSSTSSNSNDRNTDILSEPNDEFNNRRNIWNLSNISNMPIFKPGFNNSNNSNNNNNNNQTHMFPYPQNNMNVGNPMMVPGQIPPPPNNPYYYMEGNYPPYMPNNIPMYFDPNMNTVNEMERHDSNKNKRNPYKKKNNGNSNNNNNNNHNVNNSSSNKGKHQINPYLDNKNSQSNLNVKSQKKQSLSPPTLPNSSQQSYVHQEKIGSVNSKNSNNNNSNNNNNSKLSNQQFHRSPLLEEFRNNSNNKKYTLKDIFGYVLEFCKDQHGSRFIQQELAVVTPSEREVIFNEIRDHILELSDDVFGNYVIQKFFEYGSETQKNILVDQFRNRMQKLSMQMYACRVIQRALEFIELQQRIDLVLELADCVLPMIKDQNGNHVIQKAIERIPIDKLPFILDSLKGQIYHLSTHAYGCRVIQRLLEFGSKDDQTRILEELHDFIPYLIQDQYGNYVIQHILQQKDEDLMKENMSPSIAKAKQEIVDIVSENVVEFSKHKFASNVVEKTILHGNEKQRNAVTSKIIPRDLEHAANLEDNAPMILMMRDQFANYVVQKLVSVTGGDEKKLIVVAIRAYLEKLNSSNSLGNRHLASVEKLANLVENVEV